MSVDVEKKSADRTSGERGIENLSFDPDAQRAKTEAADGTAHPTGRRESSYARYRSSIRASMARPPGYSIQENDPWAAKGDEQEEDDGVEEIDYRTLTWWQAGMIMIAETISLGILSLPSVLATIGFAPGVILILGLGILAWYTGYVIGQWRLKYPWVHSFGDAGEILFKPLGIPGFGRELFGWAQTIFLIFSMASHILTFTICLNTITNSATCTLVWGVIGLGVFWVCDLPRTLKKVSYMSIISFVSIFSAVMITMIDVGVERPIGNAPLEATQTLSFTDAFLSVANICFAYAGNSCFFGFIAEMRDPTEWPWALTLLQVSDIGMYVVAAIVIYTYGGPNVESPALGSAGDVVKKIAWGVAIPTIIIAGVIYGHVSAKYIFVRIFRGTRHINKRTKLSTIVWFSVTGVVWIIAWIIAESIPDFNDLLALISSLLATWFTYGIPGIMWLYLNHGQWFDNWKKMCLFCLNVGLFLIGLAICVLGLWSSGTAIASGASGASWSCQSNAQ